VEKLQALRRRANSTTPHDLLSQAIDVLRVRPILFQRHNGQAERVLANVDLFLSMTQAYAIRGLQAFAEAMTTAWTDESRAVEGRPDAQEEAVALYSMHAAKGLEWPIVVPINTMTMLMATESALTDRENNRFYCPVFGVFPVGYDEAREVEKAELDRERIRLWYVTTTRARELLVIPRLDARASSSSWIALLDLSLSGLPALDLAHFPVDAGAMDAPFENTQTREIFAKEAAFIADQHHQLTWMAPSRDEGVSDPVLEAETAEITISNDVGELFNRSMPIAVQGGRERGVVIHKLFDEVLTGETGDDPNALAERAAKLIRELGQPVFEDPAKGLSDVEIAGCISRTLALPEIVALRPWLVPEFPVYASDLVDNVEHVTAGVTDATSFAADGSPQVIIDWKSDVNPEAETIEHYRDQVRSYLQTMGIAKGLIVFVTSGTILPVSPLSVPKVESPRR
jgi:exodeoxyribonuclease-5